MTSSQAPDPSCTDAASHTGSLDLPSDVAQEPETIAPQPRHTELPHQIGRYVILRRIGSGGMGVVYAAFDEVLERRVALKVLHEQLARNTNRALREAQALAKLAHPNVVTIHEVGTSDLGVYLAMEYVAGVTLRQWLGETPRTNRNILDVFIQAGKGLAAAHAAGLVHRDFKPDNVMVGADGRVRVMDFGIAKTLFTEETTSPRIAGTKGYMAPEQQTGRVDARADVFSYCVALHEALLGTRPGQQPPSRTKRDVPNWLLAVLERGLAEDPTQRWSTMSTLLAALENDPEARRRRAATVVASTAMATIVVVATVLGGLAWRKDAERKAADAQAEAALGTLRELVRTGDPAAESAFERFVRAPEHQNTLALGRAWLNRGDTARNRGDVARALDAFASAYVHAGTTQDAEMALTGLAETFANTGMWNSLGALCQDPTRAARPECLTAALLHRDIAKALKLGNIDPASAAMLRPLLGMVPLGRNIDQWHVADLDADGTTEVLLFDVAGRRYDVYTHQARLRGPIHVPEETVPVRGSTWAAAHSNGELRLYDLRRPEAPPWHGLAPAGVHAGAVVDLDGDGRLELYAGLKSPHRGFWTAADLEGLAELMVAHEPTHRTWSDVEALLATDLDDDGRLELVAALGPWSAYDLRVFRPGMNGEPLERVAHHLFGVTSGLARYRSPAGYPRLAVVKDDRYPNQHVYSDPPFTGPKAGVHLFELRGDELKPCGFVPPPPRLGDGLWNFARTPLVVDLDADGLDDLIVGASVPVDDQVHPFALVYRQRPDGGFTLLPIRGLYPVALLEVDGDSAPELLVRTSVDPSPGWILGVAGGSDTLDPLPRPAISVIESSMNLEPTVAHQMQRALLLAQMGMHAPAAHALHEIATSLPESARPEVVILSAEQHAAAGDFGAASRLYREVARTPERRNALLIRAAEADMQRLDLDAATKALDEANEVSSPNGAAALKAELSALRTIRERHSFDRPIEPTWSVTDPVAAHRDPIDGVLRLVGNGPAMNGRLEWDGGPLVIHVDVDIERVEIDSFAAITLRDPNGRDLLGLVVAGHGGANTPEQEIDCFVSIDHGGSMALDRRLSLVNQRRSLRMKLWLHEDRTKLTCVVDDGLTIRRADRSLTRPLAVGAYELVLGGSTGDLGNNRITRLAVRSIELHGTRLMQPRKVSLLDQARHRFANDDPRGALDLLKQSPAMDFDHGMLRALALDATGDHDGSTAILRQIRGDDVDTMFIRVALAARLQGDTFRQALRDALGQDFWVAMDVAWVGVALDHLSDPEVARVIRDITRTLDMAPHDTLRRLEAIHMLFLHRGRLRALQGDSNGARSDLEAVLALPKASSPNIHGSVDIATRALISLDAIRDPQLARNRAEQLVMQSRAPERTRATLMQDPTIAKALVSP